MAQHRAGRPGNEGVEGVLLFPPACLQKSFLLLQRATIVEDAGEYLARAVTIAVSPSLLMYIHLHATCQWRLLSPDQAY